jgi:hypothetical protein
MYQNDTIMSCDMKWPNNDSVCDKRMTFEIRIRPKCLGASKIILKWRGTSHNDKIMR